MEPPCQGPAVAELVPVPDLGFQIRVAGCNNFGSLVINVWIKVAIVRPFYPFGNSVQCLPVA